MKRFSESEIRDIVKSYARSDKKRKQVKILAELNACEPKDIVEVLTKADVYSEKPPVSKEDLAVNELLLEGANAIDDEIRSLTIRISDLRKRKELLMSGYKGEVLCH